MNAYDVLKRKNIPKPIDEKYFNQIIIEFRKSYFKEHNYFKRLSKHRKPLELINGLLNGEYNDGLSKLLLIIQNRNELKHTETNISTYVPNKLRDIWTSDSTLKTCYNAIKEYCKFWSKDFNVIAIHIAEYKAMLQVFKILERARKKIWLETNEKIPQESLKIIIPQDKIIFLPEIIDEVFKILKDYFDIKEQSEFKELLLTGKVTKTPLVFLDTGKKLADVFKKMIEKNLIINCNKKQLGNWIAQNFKYKYRNEIKSFTSDYIEKCISRNDFPCKNPLLTIVSGAIIKN